MRKKLPANLFEGLVYNGDWHTPLQNALRQAEADVIDGELKAAITILRETLDAYDECVHTVMHSMDIPAGADVHFIHNYVSSAIGKYGDVGLSSDGCITLTMSGRGGRAYLQARAQSTLSNAMANAIFALLALSGHSPARGLPPLFLRPNSRPDKH